MSIARIVELLDGILQRQRENGKINMAMAVQSGMSQSHINGLLNHKSKLENVAFGKVLMLFPDIQRVLERHLEGGGGHVAIDHSIAGDNNILIPHATPDLDAYRGRLYSAILGLGLDPQTQDRVMQAVRGTR